MKIELPPIGLKGRFRVVVSSDEEMKDVKQDLEFDNLITNVGMNRIGTMTTSNTGPNNGLATFQSLCGRIVVGSGNTAPAFTDTALVSPVAISGNVVLDSQSSSYARGWYEITVRQQFGQGVAEGNLSEIGIQSGSTSSPLWSRALILDGQGNPTTITVRDTDFLTCYYTLRIMIPKEDAIYNINVDYDEVLVPVVVTARPIATESTNILQGWGLQTFSTRANDSNSSDSSRFFSGGLNSPTANNPGGNPLGVIDHTADTVPYIPDSFYRSGTLDSALGWVNSNSLQTAIVTFLMGCWQVNFNPPLQKNNTQTMQMTFGYSWARA